MSLDNPEVTSYSVELGAFCIGIGALGLNMLNTLSGNLENIDKFVANRPWQFLKGRNAGYVHYMRYFRLIILAFLFMCPVSLGVWTGTIFYKRIANHDSVIVPVAIITVGCSIIFYALGLFYIKWRNYRPSYLNVVCFVLGSGCFLAYQLCCNFLNVSNRSFFGISAILLSCNGIVVMIVIFLNSGKDAVNFLDVLADKLQFKTDSSTVDLEEDFVRQVAGQESDKAYQVTKEELDHFYTIKEEDASLLSGGLIREFGAKSLSTQFWVSLLLYAVAVSILVGHAFIIYNTTSEYKLGFITFIAVVTTDSIIYCFYYVGLTQSVLQLCLLAIVMRVCLFAFGGDYWFYGYCVLYGILGVIVCGNIAAKYFPLIDAIEASVITQSTDSSRSNYLKDLMRTPEFIILYATALFAILTIALDASKPDGVPLTSLYSSSTEYPFWSLALLALGAVALSYMLMSIARILIRKRQKIVDDIQVYFFAPFFDIFWIYVYLCYALLIIAGFVSYGLSGDPTYLILACYIPMIVILLIYVYIYYTANDYRILKDLRAENERRDRKKKANIRRLTSQHLSQKEVVTSKYVVPPLDEVPKAVDIDNEEQKNEDDPHKGSEDATKRPEDPPSVSTIQIISKSSVKKEKTERDKVPLIGSKREQSVFSKASVAATNVVDKDMLERALAEAESTDQLADWSLDHNVVTAFFTGRLFSQDYRIIFGLVGIVTLIVVTAVTLQATNQYDSSWYGVTIGFILFDTLAVLAPIFRYLRTDIRFDLGQIVCMVVGAAAHVIYGILYFVGREGGDLDKHNNFCWVWFYVIFIPAFVAILTGVYKWYAMKWRINTFTIVMTSVLVGLVVVFTIILWVRYGWLAGVVTLVVDSFIAYGAVLTYFYAANNYYLSFGFRLANIVLVCVAACAIMIASWAVNSFEPFIGFSVTYAIIDLGAMIYCFIRVVSAGSEFDVAPIFVSPYVFPIYAYNPNRKTSVQAGTYVMGMYATLLAAVFWSILLSIYLYPMHYGISVGCLATVVMAFLTLFLITFTSMKLQECKDYISIEVLNAAWLQAKRRFVESQNAINLAELVSYKELQDVHSLILHKTDTASGTQQIRLGAKRVLNIDVDALTERQQFDLLHDIEDELRDRYVDEIRLLVDFQLIAMINAINAKLNFQSKTVNFLKAKEQKLRTFGINIRYKSITDASARHLLIMAQVRKLTPEQQVKYNELLQEFETEQEEARKKNEEREKVSQAADDTRMKKIMVLEEEKRKRKAELKNQTNLPIDEMSDSLEKYQKILAQFRSDGKQYLDKQFLPENKSLGEQVRTMTTGWKRASPDMILYDKTISAMDVKQGALGDCYYLSAISVLGDRFVKNCLVTKPEEVSCGAFCVRFFKGGEEEEFVIVDSNFPVSNNDWAFVRSENGTELWPMILEKAYAKLYGSYENIEAGKVQYALADLTGGAPQQLKLETESNNLDAFWARLSSYYKAGYLLGAGSPEHEMGDRAQSPDGIIQGHAYSLLEVNEFENEKLLRLRNPHGSSGAEWTGDWSDGCPKWTEAAKAKLAYVNQDDGIFWMNLGDFCDQYANLYICRIFDQSWKFVAAEVLTRIYIRL